MTEPVVTWHFSRADRRLGYEDGRIIKRGVAHEVSGEIVLCRWGLHGSVEPLDALYYAPGCIVSRCEHTGEIIFGKDKVVSSRREYIAVADAGQVLADFARWCADRAAARNAVNADAAVYAARNAAYDAAYYAELAVNADAANIERQLQNEWLTEHLCDLIQENAADD